MGEYLGEMAVDSMVDFSMDYIISVLAPLIQSFMWIVVLLSIPALIFAAAYCFFGIKIYRILLVISGIFGGGTAGMLFLGIVTNSGAGAVIGFILFGALIGVLSWYIYKIFLFIQTFFSCLFATASILFVITNNMSVALTIGIIVAIASGILICIYTKLLIMITTAYKGAASIASVLSLFFITSKAHSVVNLLLLIAFTVLGFYVQNRFFSDQYNAGKKDSSILAKYKLVGIEGMYKGFEFDLEDTITLGRDVDNCNVIFPDTCAGVSRIQCQVSYDNKNRTVFVVDKFSSYGTTLNGAKLEINRPMPLKNGDVIMFGENNVFKLNC